MTQLDYGNRYQLERFRAFYESGGQRFDLQAHFIDTGLNVAAAWTAGIPVVRTLQPGEDFPFLWTGNSMLQTDNAGVGAGLSFQVTTEGLIRATILKNGVTLGDAKSASGSFRLALPVQTWTGYAGKPALFAYPYLFEAHDQIQFEYLTDSTGILSQHVLVGYKVIPRS